MSRSECLSVCVCVYMHGHDWPLSPVYMTSLDGVLSVSLSAATLASSTVLNNETHFLHKLLPERSTHDYNLRPRSHDRWLNVRTDNKNFLSRMLFKDIY